MPRMQLSSGASAASNSVAAAAPGPHARRLPAGDAEGRAALPPARHGAARDLRGPGASAPARRSTRDEIDSFYTRGEKPVGVLRVLRALDEHAADARPTTCIASSSSTSQDAAAHNVRHSEFFWNPTGTARDSGIAYPQAQAAIVRAIARRRRATRHRRPTCAGDRPRGRSGGGARDGRLGRRASRDEVVGIGIDYREIDRPPELFAAAYRGGAPGRPEDDGARRRVRHAVAQRADGRRRAQGRSHRSRLHGDRQAGVRRALRRRRHRLHGGADQLLLPAHAGARALGARPSDPAHARPRPAHPPEHRRPDAAPRHADRGLDDDGARFRLRSRSAARLHAQRPRRRLDRRGHAPALARAGDRALRRLRERLVASTGAGA